MSLTAHCLSVVRRPSSFFSPPSASFFFPRPPHSLVYVPISLPASTRRLPFLPHPYPSPPSPFRSARTATDGQGTWLRIELEAVETVARSYWERAPAGASSAPPVQLAAVATKGGGELVLLSRRRGGAAKGELLEHWVAASCLGPAARRGSRRLPDAPQRQDQPHGAHTSGEAALPGATTVETARWARMARAARGTAAARNFATDSLGMVREVNAGAAASAREAVAKRAVLMYGVARPLGRLCRRLHCRAVMEDIVRRQPLRWRSRLTRLCAAGQLQDDGGLLDGFRVHCNANRLEPPP